MVENSKGIGDQLRKQFVRLSQCPVWFHIGRMSQYQCLNKTINPYRPCASCKENAINWPPTEEELNEGWESV